jgi:hypothetical protein
VDNTDNDWVADKSFGSIDNTLVKLLPFGKVRTNSGIINAFGKVVAFGKVIDKDLITAESFGQVDHGYETVESFGKVDSGLATAESFGQVDHGYETVESFRKVDSNLVKMLPIGEDDIDYDAIGKIMSVLASNVGTHKVIKRQCYIMHMILILLGKIYCVKDLRGPTQPSLQVAICSECKYFHLLLSMFTSTLTRTQQNNFGEF